MTDLYTDNNPFAPLLNLANGFRCAKHGIGTNT